jgi:hypothetical protein
MQEGWRMSFLDEVNKRKNAKKNEIEKQNQIEQLQERLKSKYHCYMTDPYSYILSEKERDFITEVIEAVPKNSWCQNIRKYQWPDKSIHIALCGLDSLSEHSVKPQHRKVRVSDGNAQFPVEVLSSHNEFDVIFRELFLDQWKKNLNEEFPETKVVVAKDTERMAMQFIRELPQYELQKSIAIQQDKEWSVLFKDGFFFTSDFFPDRDFFVEWISSL